MGDHITKYFISIIPYLLSNQEPVCQKEKQIQVPRDSDLRLNARILFHK